MLLRGRWQCLHLEYSRFVNGYGYGLAEGVGAETAPTPQPTSPRLLQPLTGEKPSSSLPPSLPPPTTKFHGVGKACRPREHFLLVPCSSWAFPGHGTVCIFCRFHRDTVRFGLGFPWFPPKDICLLRGISFHRESEDVRAGLTFTQKLQLQKSYSVSPEIKIEEILYLPTGKRAHSEILLILLHQ